MKPTFYIALLAAVTAAATGDLAAQEAKAPPLFSTDFQALEAGPVPDDFMVLDGGFAIREEAGNKFLELPGAPLESFGVLFGPAEKGGVRVSARVLGTSRGRRMPAFALGLSGVAGFRLQVSPAKKLLELYKGDTVIASTPYEWTSGTWTKLHLEVRESKPGEWTILGSAWSEGQPKPADPLINHKTSEDFPPGRASVWGRPYSGTPIRFDDLAVEQVTGGSAAAK